MKIEIVKYTQQDLEKCHEFAVGQLETSKNHYARRKQTNEAKIIQDIITGKLGEIAAYRLLRRNGVYCGQPDFEIYDSRGKSFDADLTWKGIEFHCKSQTEESAARYGTSWILQWGGRGHGHTDKLFRNRDDNDFLIPSTVHDSHVRVYGVIKINKLFEEGMIKEPKLDWFKDTKRAIYMEDLATLNWSDRWGFLRSNRNV